MPIQDVLCVMGDNMITIALDENGDFEGFKNLGESAPLYIGWHCI